MFSSIEEDQRIEVINKCYWPILNLVREYKIPIGIEATALTLELINNLDKSWITELKKLIQKELCEFIGSGYSQIIGPIVPYEINLNNQIIGKKIYKELLNIEPKIALINEQAFSSNLISLYKKAGYKTIIMEWNNSFSYKDWDPKIGMFKQETISRDGNKINVIWNNSINFQKFQRYIHSEISFVEFIEFIEKNNENMDNYFLLYGSDAEIFDFRPGRFKTEAKIQNCEWEKINKLFEFLKSYPKFNLIGPSNVDFSKDAKYRKSDLILNSSQQPISVKKQPKYNIFRWALTGKDDYEINKICYGIYEKLLTQEYDLNKYKEICYLWSSDFRTHITKKRWDDFLIRLHKFDSQIKFKEQNIINFLENKSESNKKIDINLKKKNNLIVVSFKDTIITFNKLKGLAIKSFIKKGISFESIFGTITHGTFSDINFSADFYSGNLNFQSPGKAQVTDLNIVDPHISRENNLISLRCYMRTPNGDIRKEWIIDSFKEMITLRYKLNWNNPGIGKLSIVPITLNPNAFDKNKLYFLANNGSDKSEKFLLNNIEVDHSENVSFLVSSNHGLGLTDGKFAIGDENKKIEISFKPSQAAFLGQLINKKIDDVLFTRFILTGREFDDTAKYQDLNIDTEINFKLNILK
tara:strand:+ start:814 stop:2730 length:1917 start_codon:yes stop_codon:yes gene_type:complete